MVDCLFQNVQKIVAPSAGLMSKLCQTQDSKLLKWGRVRTKEIWCKGVGDACCLMSKLKL